MDLVEEKLKEWKLEEYLSNFENEGIDEESFFLLDDETMKLLLFLNWQNKKYLNSFIEASNFSSVPTSDSTVPPCNTDITYSCINDSLTIFPIYFNASDELATKTFQISTEAYGSETLSRAHVLEWYKSFSEERVSVEVKSCLKGTDITSVEVVQVKAENLRKGLPKTCSRAVTSNGSPECRINGDRYRAMITNFFIPELNNHDVQELWFQQGGASCHTARATIDLLKDTFGDRLTFWTCELASKIL
ncbi:hypothetical protein TNCV_4070431 [Trichonephila clavipes]|nr:hypothetical protein TNCV_4070431 [Trichonephila clavipes]